MSSNQHVPILRSAVHYLRTTLKVERVIAVYEGTGCSHGFEPGALWDKADLSQGVISSLLARKRPALVPDTMMHPVYGERTSTVLSNIGGVMFLPLRCRAGTVRGFLYLDSSRQNKVVLTQAILDRIQSYVRETLEPLLGSLQDDLTWEEALKVDWLPPPEDGPAEA